MKRYISSTDDYTPHVTAQWKDDTLIHVSVGRVMGQALTKEDLEYAWAKVPELKAKRKECSKD